MSSIWQYLKRKVSRRKRDPIAKERSPGDAPDGARDTLPASTTNGYTLDPYWQPLTREEILADLAVEYEDVEEKAVRSSNESRYHHVRGPLGHGTSRACASS